MTVTTATVAADIPRTPRTVAAAVAGAEVAALQRALSGLEPDQWDAPTDCDRWRVREMVAHLIGAGEDSIRLRTMLRHMWQGRRRYPDWTQLDGLNEAQVDDRRDWSADRLRDAAAEVLPRAVRARARALPIRNVPLPTGEPLGRVPLAYLNDVIYLRDLWLHRVDIARATGTPFVRGDHEAEIVRQVVRDLGREWTGPPVTVRLEGPAAGAYALGRGAAAGEVVVTDDVEWLRALGGRPAGDVLEAVAGTPPLQQLRDAQVVF